MGEHKSMRLTIQITLTGHKIYPRATVIRVNQAENKVL
jgi:hypothetical protein